MALKITESDNRLQELTMESGDSGPGVNGCSGVYLIARTRLEIVGWGKSRNIAEEEQMPGKQHLRGVSAKEQ